ncbi:sulfurtransferase [Corynebacterium sp. sy017]|uniref:sulfurtransferase n=1 Tax=unclassified Corynebacterium TaxID=2624378 RepID=UPI0011853EE5|nr:MULTISPECIES: sulfurtransferase [unclassified Corynebacterium]MBP3088700.1 sulfurtransferase [Corynebacterium sp. sy017]QDZ42101.1 sulfurtransferase [Corynebacterium sp. sy039]TSD91987.1 sulfurtransferase [Corynebacterium sp. SY003]
MAVPFDPHPLLQDYAHPECLVSAAWLSARLGTDGIRVIESDEDSLLYDIGHIPGAIRINWLKDLNDGSIRDFISGEQFAALMEEKGISRDDTVIIYGDKANSWAAFTFWIFKLFGHEDVRLLNGGRDAWMAEERDTSFSIPEYPATHYPVVERVDVPLRAFFTDVLEKNNNTVLLDVREEDEYIGKNSTSYPHKGALRQGHIPSAMNITWDKTILPNTYFRSHENLKEIFQTLDDSMEIITYCQTGERAAHTWFVLKYLVGIKNVRIYDGSWAEWGNMVRNPIIRGSLPA